MSSAARIEQDWEHVALLAADLHDAHARLVDFVVAVLADGSWQAAGLRSPTHWLMLRVGLCRAQADAVVLLARRADELPLTLAALRDGRISLDQAAVVARHTPPEFDATVAELAQYATVTQLQRSVSRYDFTLDDPEPADDPGPDPVPDADSEVDGEVDGEHGDGQADEARHCEPEDGDDDLGPTAAASSGEAGSDAGQAEDVGGQSEAVGGPARTAAQPEAVEPAHLSMGYDEHDRFRLRYDAPAEIGALVEAALREAKDHLFRDLSASLDEDGEPRDRRSLDGDLLDPDHDVCAGGRPRITWADALALVATRSLDAPGRTHCAGTPHGPAGHTTGATPTGPTPTGPDEADPGEGRPAQGTGSPPTTGRASTAPDETSDPDVPTPTESGPPDAPGAPPTRWPGWARWARYRVQVHLDTDGAWLTGRPRLPQHVTDKLTCGGTLTPVWETAGQPVNLGRSYRVVPDRLRDLVLDRDRGCRFPACASRHHLEIHHLLHWRDGGRTDLDNLLALCPFHHDGHHRGEFTITGDPTLLDGLTFETEHGLLIGPPTRTTHRPLVVVPGDQSTESDRTSVAAAGQEGTSSTRPAARLGRRYPAPSGETLHLHLVDFTPHDAARAEHD